MKRFASTVAFVCLCLAAPQAHATGVLIVFQGLTDGQVITSYSQDYFNGTFTLSDPDGFTVIGPGNPNYRIHNGTGLVPAYGSTWQLTSNVDLLAASDTSYDVSLASGTTPGGAFFKIQDGSRLSFNFATLGTTPQSLKFFFGAPDLVPALFATQLNGPAYQLTQITVSVPEPGSVVMLGLGLVGIIGLGWRVRRAAPSGA